MGYVSLADLACVPPTAGETGLGRRSGMGQFDVIVGAVAQVVSAGITAGAAIGAAAINKDAAKYAIKKQTMTDLNIALAKQKTELAQAQAMLEAQKFVAQEQTEQVKITQTEQTKQVQSVGSNVLPLAILGLGVAGAVAIWVSNREPKRRP